MSDTRSNARQHFYAWALACAGVCGALFGTLVLVVGAIFLMETLAQGHTVQLIDLGLFSFGAAVCIVGGRAFHRGRRHVATLAAAAAISKFSARPILLLRPFSEDERNVGGFYELMFAKTWGDSRNFENRIVPLLARIAPVTAIGKPDEVITPRGAFREYVTEDEWRRRFFELTASAQLIVWMAGTSREVIWEFEQLLRKNRPRELVMVLPYIGMPLKVRRAHWRALCEAVNPYLIHALPEQIGKALVVIFDERWVPSLIEPKVGLLERALNPVFWPRAERALENAVRQLGEKYLIQKKTRHMLKDYVVWPCLFWGFAGGTVGGSVLVMHMILQQELGLVEWGFLIYFFLLLCSVFVACVYGSRSNS